MAVCFQVRRLQAGDGRLVLLDVPRVLERRMVRREVRRLQLRDHPLRDDRSSRGRPGRPDEDGQLWARLHRLHVARRQAVAPAPGVPQARLQLLHRKTLPTTKQLASISSYMILA